MILHAKAIVDGSVQNCNVLPQAVREKCVKCVMIAAAAEVMVVFLRENFALTAADTRVALVFGVHVRRIVMISRIVTCWLLRLSSTD